MLAMLLKEDVELVEVDMCNFGMVASDEYGEALVRKRTRVLTNSADVARRISRKCNSMHRHALSRLLSRLALAVRFAVACARTALLATLRAPTQATPNTAQRRGWHCRLTHPC